MSALSEPAGVNFGIPRWILVFAALAALLLAVGAGISLLAPQRLVAPESRLIQRHESIADTHSLEI